MEQLAEAELYFVCGSQHLYGPQALGRVEEDAVEVVRSLNAPGRLPLPLRFAGVLTSSAEIRSRLAEIGRDPRCAGVVVWMHTFSPSKMWIAGLSSLSKPLCHLHTQYNRDLPWSEIDMDFMNLNQSAHGDREAGYLQARMGIRRKVVVGHHAAPEVAERLAAWARAARAWHDWQGARFARFGDNMRQVAVTEGDKVAAELRFGFSVDGFGVGDLAERVRAAPPSEVAALVEEYLASYDAAAELLPGGRSHPALIESARIELGLRGFLRDNGCKGFTDTFEDLTGLGQLPGLPAQRLMADGYGFGGEGDWKAAALVRALKVMGLGLPGGSSFMEDYTYHLAPQSHLVLGAHMLEVCPSLASHRPRMEIHPLAIGGKDDPVRLVFSAGTGPAVNVSLIDLGHRFRMLAAAVDLQELPPMPKLPVARALWSCRPDFKTATAAWIYAGGSHHTALSRAVGPEVIEDFAEIFGVELLPIDQETRLPQFRQLLRQGEAYYGLAQGLRG